MACQNGFYRAVHLPVSARRGQSVGWHVENAVAHFSFLQPHRLGGLYHRLHPDWIFFGKKWKQLEAWLGPTALYLIFAGIILIVLGVIFRHSLSKFSARHFSKKRRRKHK
jgi:hypothetical protein